MEADQLIETTTNRDTKTPGGAIGERNVKKVSLHFCTIFFTFESVSFVLFLKGYFGGDLNSPCCFVL